MKRQVFTQAEDLEKECSRFLSTYSEALPRIARRGMEPILTSLVSIFEGVYSRLSLPCPPILLFSYRINTVTKTRDDQALPYVIGTIVYLPEKKALGWRVQPHVMSVIDIMTIAANPLQDWREVSLEDIVELGVGVVELVENIKRLATTLCLQEASMMATQKPASA